jgi:hypothetical protein
MTLSFAPEAIETWPLDRLRPYVRNARTHAGVDHPMADDVTYCHGEVPKPITPWEGRCLLRGLANRHWRGQSAEPECCAHLKPLVAKLAGQRRIKAYFGLFRKEVTQRWCNLR